MFTCVFVLYVAVSECLTVRQQRIEPVTKYRQEFSPLLISCKLSDIVTISTLAVPYNGDTLCYLRKPNGDVTELNVTSAIPQYDTVLFETMKNENKLLFPTSSYRVDNVNFGYKIDSINKDVFGNKDNEFVIGPLMEEDHGNWVLSIYHNEGGTWIEVFQIITIEIIEQVPTEPLLPVLNSGDTLKLGFAYPIKHLQGCQLTIPQSSYDRYSELTSTDRCTYLIRNVTKDDEGTWEIRSVGAIVYEARTHLRVKNKVT